jgi:hypothetical protein
MFTGLFRLLVGSALLAGALWLLRAAMKWWIDGPGIEPPTDPWPEQADAPGGDIGLAGEPYPATNGVAADMPAAPPETPDRTWVRLDEAGATLSSHPVKAKESSRLYHLPGMLAYERTRPDRCYPSPEAAEADGFVRAKR